MRLKIAIVSLLSIVACATGTKIASAHDSAQCIKVSRQCSSMCNKHAAEFAKKGGQYADAERINLLKDCSAICQLNADFESRHSANRTQVAKLCSDICRQCASKCEELKDADLKHCIAMCRSCADQCDQENKSQ